ncbi:MAG: cell envelope integrity EipB family protein [Proteobacteria bacterium]|nr:cell envelope integrity EipB family protein [Pseudomonadota bacterium]
MSALLVSAAFGPAAGAVELAPHRAIYSMKMGKIRAGSVIVDTRGAMYLEWARSCEGWTLTQRVRLQLIDNEGKAVDTDSSFSSWESENGLSYRFTVRNLRNGKVSEDLGGKATLAGKGEAGTAVFERPKGKIFPLPKGSIFPTEHVVQLIERAEAGGKRLFRVVFDGASLDGPLEINAIIGSLIEGKKDAKDAEEALTSRPSWRMRLAFFPVKARDSTPDYELGVRLFDNGVAEDFVLDYGDFTVLAKLEKIEALPQPSC